MSRPALYPILVVTWCAVAGFALAVLLVRGFDVPFAVGAFVVLSAAAPLVYRSLRVRWAVADDTLRIYGVLVNRSVPVSSIVDFEFRRSLLPASALLTAVRTVSGRSWRVPSTLRLNDRAQAEALRDLRSVLYSVSQSSDDSSGPAVEIRVGGLPPSLGWLVDRVLSYDRWVPLDVVINGTHVGTLSPRGPRRLVAFPSAGVLDVVLASHHSGFVYETLHVEAGARERVRLHYTPALMVNGSRRRASFKVADRRTGPTG